MRFSSIFAGINLARKAITTATCNPQDIPEVLSLVNAHVAVKVNGTLFCDRVGGEISKGFAIKGRGYDAVPVPGYPTCWIWCPNGYRFKVGIDASVASVLSEDVSHMDGIPMTD